MRITAFFVFLCVAGGVSFYVWEHNKTVDAIAAQNNGAVCAINIQLAEDLYKEFSTGDVNGILGNLSTEQVGQQTVSDLVVATSPTQLLTQVWQGIKQLSVIGQTNCTPVVSKIPPMTPGRVKITVDYYRMFEVQPQQTTEGATP